MGKKAKTKAKAKAKNNGHDKDKGKDKVEDKNEDKETNASEQDEAVETFPGFRPLLMDPWGRWGVGEVPWSQWRLGRIWPDRFLGEVGELFDHIKIEEYLDDESMVIRAEIPGVDPDTDIDISVEDLRLVIRAERTSQTEDDTDGYRSEFRYGSLSRVVDLPDDVKVDDIEADYADGILEVRIPLADQDSGQKKTIAVGRR